MKKEELRIKLMEIVTDEVVEYTGKITNLKLYDANYLACRIAEESGNEEAFEAFNNFLSIAFLVSLIVIVIFIIIYHKKTAPSRGCLNSFFFFFH